MVGPARFLEPMLAQPTVGTKLVPPLVDPSGTWVFEPKLDGLRCIAVRSRGPSSLFSRNNLLFNARFPALVNAVSGLPADDFVIDGEIVGVSREKADFAALQQGSPDRVEYWLFDILWLLGKDVRHLPLEVRKDLLAAAVPEGKELKVVRPLAGEAAELYARSCESGWEGLVAKRAGSPYRQGRSTDWYKLKCECRQELVVGGFTAPGGSRTGFGALLLGYWESSNLTYAGKVGTGFDEGSLERLSAALLVIERASSPFSTVVPERRARWVEPELVAEVAFTNWTTDGCLRHPSFLGLRPDKASRDVVREPCGPRAKAR